MNNDIISKLRRNGNMFTYGHLLAKEIGRDPNWNSMSKCEQFVRNNLTHNRSHRIIEQLISDINKKSEQLSVAFLVSESL